MTRLLLIETSPRGTGSVSRTLTARFLAEWRAAHPDGEIVTRDLAAEALPHVTMDWLAAYFTPPQALTPEMKAQLALSDKLVQELLAADEIVISTPVYNYNIPASLKAWVDHIVRKGLTLGFTGEGLVTGKKATLIVASGGVYGEGSPIAAFLERNPAGGIHHICYEVDDIIAARDRLKAEGARVLGDGEPKIGAHGKPVLFLHPKDFQGTLVELEQI